MLPLRSGTITEAPAAKELSSRVAQGQSKVVGEVDSGEAASEGNLSAGKARVDVTAMRQQAEMEAATCVQGLVRGQLSRDEVRNKFMESCLDARAGP